MNPPQKLSALSAQPTGASPPTTPSRPQAVALGSPLRRGAALAALAWLVAAGCSDRAASSDAALDGSGATDTGAFDVSAEIAQQRPDSTAEMDAGALEDASQGVDGAPGVDGEIDGSASWDGPGPDVADVPDGGPPTGDADARLCDPGTARCVSPEISRSCDALGLSPKDVTCPLGCLASGARAGSCREVTPSNGFSGLTCGDEPRSTVSFDVQEPTEVDPDHGSYSTVTSTIFPAPVYRHLGQGGAAPPVGVFHLSHLFIAEGQTLTLRRGAEAAVAFLVDGDVTIDGTLDVSGHLGVSGPGATSLGLGGAGTGLAGSGGGGFGSSGAAGGLTAAGEPGHGGVSYGSSALVPLWGGSPGAGNGGGGGGALQISACGTLRVGPRGRIVASGGGAPTTSAGAAAKGSGGGAGGGISLEAKQIVIEGWVMANGGSGSGAASETVAGEAGQDGSLSATVPAPGGASASGTSAGGGSCAASGPEMAGAASDGGPSGGGGGGLGRVRIATLTVEEGGATPALSGSFSPTPAVETWSTH